MSSTEPEFQLDLLGEPCPYPALQTMEALKDLPAGSVIEVLTDCPQAFIAIPDDVAREGHELVVPPERTGPNSRFLIRTHRR
jgi:TusA-related sulfurtransferase